MSQLKQAPFSIRTMTESDFPRCQQLREQAGWNQTLMDWQRFLSYNPKGCFVAEIDSEVVGTVCTIPYQDRFGWVAMVIVDKDHRREGIGTFLLKKGIQHLEQRGLTIKLDATPEGKLLYDTLGFEDEYGAARYEAQNLEIPQVDIQYKTIELADLDSLDRFDAPIFGASRKQVLRSYLEKYKGLGFMIHEMDEIAGYILAREGTNAFHIGPWVATNSQVARQLLAVMLMNRKPDKVFVDIVEPNPYSLNIIEQLGFQQQRPFIRMYKGKNTHPGQPELIYGISGPELG